MALIPQGCIFPADGRHTPRVYPPIDQDKDFSQVDLDTKVVRVHGTDVDEAAVMAAIDEAGYDAVAA